MISGLNGLPRSISYRTRRFIDFASHTPEQLDQLAVACGPATFGLGNQDVYDETYRKALKMDPTDFVARFDPTVSSLIDILRENLLQGQAERMEIKPEIHKLNVYGSLWCRFSPLSIILSVP